MGETTKRPKTIVVDSPTVDEIEKQIRSLNCRWISLEEIEILHSCISAWPFGSVKTASQDIGLIEISWSWNKARAENETIVFGPRVTISRTN